VAGKDASGYHDLEGDSTMTEALARAFKQAEQLSVLEALNRERTVPFPDAAQRKGDRGGGHAD
jgi:hypothetical protein